MCGDRLFVRSPSFPSIINKLDFKVFAGRHSSRWWHSNPNDPREHITVAFVGAERPSRVHIYRDGTVNLRPDRPRRVRDVTEDDDGYDSVPEFDGEEFEDDED